MQVTSIEELVDTSEGILNNAVIEFGAPRWGTPADGSSGTSGSSPYGYGGYGTSTRVYKALTEDSMAGGLSQVIAARQAEIRAGLEAKGQPLDETTLEDAYADDRWLQILQPTLPGWTRDAGGRGQGGLPASGSVPAGSRLPVPGGAPEITAAISGTAGTEVPVRGTRKTVIGPIRVSWGSSSYSKNQCVNVAVVWRGGERTPDRSK